MVDKHQTLARFHIWFVAFGLATVFAVLSAMSYSGASAMGEINQCSGAIEITNPGDEQSIDDSFDLELFNYAPAQPINEVKFYIDDDLIGSAVQDQVTPGFWTLNWDTTTVENGEYELFAQVRYQGTSQRCVTDEQELVVDNVGATGTEADLEIFIIPDEWVGPTNVNYNFEAVAILEDNEGDVTDVTDSTTFTWSTTIGSIDSFGEFGDFFSGPQPGIGEVSLTGQYGGQTEEADAFVDVTPSSGNFSYPIIDEEDEEEESEDEQRERLIGSRVRSNDRSDSDEELANCILDRLGNESYDEITNNKQRFSGDQFDQVRTCFAQRQFVVPSNLAPVDPGSVNDLTENGRLRITDAHNTTDESGNNRLQFNGTTEPNATVLIYVFSEPLILTAQADSDGLWSYTLDDPLAPGEHEAYVLVETDDGQFERSGNFVFAIESAEATDDNPNGYGLTLTTSADSAQTTTIYIAGVAVVVLIASVILTKFVWFKRDGGIDESNEQNKALIATSASLNVADDSDEPDVPSTPSATASGA